MYLLDSLGLNRNDTALIGEQTEIGLSLDEGNIFQSSFSLLPEFASTQSDVTLGQLDNHFITGLDGGVTYASSSELGELSTNLETLEGDINTIKDGVTFAREVVENIESALSIFEKIEKGADFVADVMKTFSTILKLVAKVPALKVVANGLSNVFKDLSDEVKKIEAKAKKIDDKLQDEKDLAEDTRIELEGYELTLENTADNVSNIRFAVDTADTVYGLIDSFTSFDLMIIDNAVSGANGAFDILYGSGGIKETLTNRVNAVTTAFDGVTGFLSLARGIDAQISAITNSLRFLEAPLKVLNVALKPVEWALDALGFIFNTFVAPILNPILDALGITAVFDSIKNALLGLFPDIDILDDIDVALTDVFADINLGITTDIFSPLTNFVTDIQADILDSVLDIIPGADEAVFLEVGGAEPTGGTGDDLISGNQHDNNLQGNDGDDIIVPGQGDDIVIGGIGNDAVVFNGLAGEFKITRLDTGEVEVLHTKPREGEPDQGNNTVTDVELFVFIDVAISNADLDNITTMTTTTFVDTLNKRDFVFGTTGNDNIDGGGDDDYLNGGAGVDFIQGGEGNDILSGGGADSTDTFDGGNGQDTITFAGYAVAASVTLLGQSLRDSNPTLFIFNETHFASNVEQLIGSSLDDILYGDQAANVLSGEYGSDILRGLWGNDVISGGRDDDFLFGDRGVDQLSGDGGSDYLMSGFGDDILDGGEGEDTAYYGSYNLPSIFTSLETVLSNTNYLGGPQIAVIPDRITYNGVTQKVFEYNAAGTLIGTDDLTSVERIIGANGNNVFVGAADNDYAEVFVGGDGNDIFRSNGAVGSGSNDAYGGGGDDAFFLGYYGTESAAGDTGDDTFIYSHAGDIVDGYFLSIVGGTGYDKVDFSASTYAFGESAGVLSFVGAIGEATQTFIAISGIEEFTATDFDDELDFYNGHVELVYAGLGHDKVMGSFNAGTNTIYGGEGNDELIANEVADAFFYGGAGNDTFRGSGDFFEINPPNNTYDGGDGDDTFYAAAAVETIIGGDGVDRVIYTGFEGFTSSGVEVDMLDPNAFTFGYGAGDSFLSIENIIGSENPDIILATDEANEILGNDGGDQLHGRGGDDTIYGGEGFDDMYGGDGDDVMHGGNFTNEFYGGAGSDTASFAFFESLYGALTADLKDLVGTNAIVTDGDGGGSGQGSANTLVSIENIKGGDFADDIRGDDSENQLTGADGDDVLMGRLADDSLIGGVGDDMLDGGAGDDTLIGGAGNDTIFGGDGVDTANYQFNESGITVNLNSGLVNEAYFIDRYRWENDQLSEAPRMSMVAGRMYTPLEVAQSAPVNADDPTDFDFNLNLDDDNGTQALIDLIEYDGLTDEDTMLEDFNFVILDGLETAIDILSGIENFTSGEGNDDLTGTSGDNILIANGGNDTVRGGFGDDMLYGGEGDDNLQGDAVGAFPVNGFVGLNIGGQDHLPNTDGSLASHYSGSTGDYLEAANVSTMGGSNITVEMLYQASETLNGLGGTGGLTSLFSYAVDGSTNEFAIWGSNGNIQLVANGVAYDMGVSTDALFDGAVHRLSVTFQHIAFSGADDRGIFTLFIDGVDLGSVSIDNPNMAAIQSGGRINIGQEQDSAGVDPLFDVRQVGSGYFGDVRVFNDLRTEAEIQANLYTHADDTDANLVENWIFDDGIQNRTGTIVMTQTGGSITGIGEVGDDTLVGGAGDDSLFGAGGDDILEGGSGADVLNGGGGNDTASYASSGDDDTQQGVNVNLASGVGNFEDASGDTLTSIENLIGSSYDDTLTGNGVSNILMGGAGNDDLRGGGGDDIIEGGAGADFINGQGGFDTLSYAGSSGRVVINLINGTAAQGDAAGDVFNGFVDLIGSAFDDIFNGSQSSNSIWGGAGNDYLAGRGGGDDIFGGAGDDQLFGGGAWDNLDGGTGNDTLSGGFKGRDIFIFADSFGQDVITDFDNNLDTIDFTQNTIFNTFADVTAAVTQNGSDVIIQDGVNQITLQNFNLPDLDATDFTF